MKEQLHELSLRAEQRENVFGDFNVHLRHHDLRDPVDADYALVNVDRGNNVIQQRSFRYDGLEFSLHDPKAQSFSIDWRISRGCRSGPAGIAGSFKPIVSCTSIEILGLLENLELDAGLTYIENEPLGKVRTIPLFDESYRLITAPDSLFGDREQVTWKRSARYRYAP